MYNRSLYMKKAIWTKSILSNSEPHWEDIDIFFLNNTK